MATAAVKPSAMRSRRALSMGVLPAPVAGQVMRGARHPGVRDAKHFHTAGWRFPYTNMHYVLMAGGNEFYEKY